MSVTLRKRVLPSGKTLLYLDIYREGKRQREYLKLQLNGDRFHNHETMRMAETIRAKRELEVQAEAHGLGASLHRRGSFVKYIEKLRDTSTTKGTREAWDNALVKFQKFLSGKDLTFGECHDFCV